MTYFRSTDPLPRAPDAAGLVLGILANTPVPRGLNQILQIQNARQLVTEHAVASSFGTLHVRDKHLDVTVSAEWTIPLLLGHMLHARMAEVDFIDLWRSSAQICQDRHDAGYLSVASLRGNESAVSADPFRLVHCRPTLELVE